MSWDIYMTNFSSNNGNRVLFWTFVLYLVLVVNFSSGQKPMRTNGSQDPLLAIGIKFRAFNISIYRIICIVKHKIVKV